MAEQLSKPTSEELPGKGNHLQPDTWGTLGTRTTGKGYKQEECHRHSAVGQQKQQASRQATMTEHSSTAQMALGGEKAPELKQE